MANASGEQLQPEKSRAPEMTGQKISAKKKAAGASKPLETRLRDCIDAGDIEGAFKLMNGIIADSAGYHGRRLGLSRETVEDCIQETLLKIMKKWDRVCESDKLIAYISKIAMNKVIDTFRREKRCPEAPFPEIDPDADDPVLLEFEQELIPGADEMAAISQASELFNGAVDDVNKKNPNCREALDMYQEAQTNDERFDGFCKRLGLVHQKMYARFRRCLEQIIEHHNFPKFWEFVARLYPNVLRKKQEQRRPKGE